MASNCWVFVITVKLFLMFQDSDRETYFNENVSCDVETLAIQHKHHKQAPLNREFSS